MLYFLYFRPVTSECPRLSVSLDSPECGQDDKLEWLVLHNSLLKLLRRFLPYAQQCTKYNNDLSIATPVCLSFL